MTIGRDYKLLLGILNYFPLKKIDNSRLSRLKEKTLGWELRIIHIAGIKLSGPDALSGLSLMIWSMETSKDNMILLRYSITANRLKLRPQIQLKPEEQSAWKT